MRPYGDYTPHETVSVDLDDDSKSILDLIAGIDLIPLEAVESFILPGMAQTLVVDGRIYVYCDTQYKFACYSIDEGKHIYTIARHGRGPGEYVEPGNFSVTSDGMLAVYDPSSGGKLLHYDSTGKYSHT